MASSHPQPDWKPLSAADLSVLLPDTYKVVDLLGRGGMGAVYLARQVNLDRLVAIKVLPLQDAAQTDDQMNFAERFVQEARTMARISHNGIVAVFDFGRVKVKPTGSELLYFVMEYMDGTDVLNLIREQSKLKPDDALSITAHVCDALAFAHEKGMIHRDIKPANVMINADGFVKVADFGLARPISMSTSAGLTQSGFAVGTPDFMAPEMLTLNAPVDHRSDLYSVGVMLYQMLTSQIPRGSFKPASALCGCDRRFDAIIDKAMQSNPADRYASASALRADLDRILSTPRANAGDHTSAALKRAPGAKRKIPAKPAGGTPAKPPVPPAPKPAAPPPKTKGVSPSLVVTLVLAAGSTFGIWKATRPKVPPRTAAVPANPAPVAVPTTPPAAIPAPSRTAPWQSVVFATDPAKANPGGAREVRNGLLHLWDFTIWPWKRAEEFQAGVIRTTVVWTPASDAVELLACSLDGQDSYSLVTGPGGLLHLGIRRYRGGKMSALLLKTFNAGSDWQAGTEYTLDLIRIGRQVAVRVNGRMLDKVEDTTIGRMREIQLKAKEGEFKSAEFLNLDHLSEAEAWKRAGDDGGALPLPTGGTPSLAANPPVPSAASANPKPSDLSDRSDPSDEPTPHDLLTSPDYQWSAPENLGPKANGGAHDDSPSITGDGLTLWFNSWEGSGKPNNELWFAQRASLDSPWTSRTKADAPLSHEAVDSSPAISSDGLYLVFASQRNSSGNFRLRQSSRASLTAPWSEPVQIPSLYDNSPGNVVDDHSALAANGLLLVFRSDSRRGGQGKHDLWAAGRISTRDEWGPPANLGSSINSPESESAPVLSPDGRALLFRRDNGWWICTRATSGAEMNWGPPEPYSLPVGLLDGCLSADGTEFIGHAFRGVASGFNDLELVRCRRVSKSGAGIPSAIVASIRSAQSGLTDQVKPEPWLAAAKKRGGKLKAFGTDRDGKPMTLGPAAAYGDFTEVHAFHDEFWLARRANGDAVVSYLNDGERMFIEEKGVAQVSRGWKIAYRMNDGGVMAQNSSNKTLRRWDQFTNPKASDLLAIADLIWTFDDRGGIVEFYRNGASHVKNILPPSFFTGNLARTSAELTAMVIGADGRPHGWQAWSEPGLLYTNYPEEFKDLIECEGGSDSLVVFRDIHGRVFASDVRGEARKYAQSAPTDLPPAIRSRCGHSLQMAQLPNGTWRAWGSGVEKGYKLAEQINQLGPALDLDGSYVQNADRSKGPNGYVLYIEPVNTALAATPSPIPKPAIPVLPAPPAVKPAFTPPWPVEAGWLSAARKKGGRLKIWGEEPDGKPMELGLAATLDDVVEVQTFGSSWVARRANGDIVLSVHPKDEARKFDKESNVTHLNRGWKPAYRLASGKVKIWNGTGYASSEKWVVPEAGGLVCTHVDTLVLDRSGRIAGSYMDATTKPVPVDFLAGSRAYTAAELHLVSIGADGRARSWVAVNPGSTAPAALTFSPAFSDLVECEGCDNSHVVFRSRTGRVLTASAMGNPPLVNSTSNPPAGLPPAVHVRNGNDVTLAQMTDGTWRAWGKAKALIDKVASLGPVIDLDACLYDTRGKDPLMDSRGYVLYIEPAPGAMSAAIARKPPPREALVFGRSRYLFVPLLGSDPPHWDAARLRAEAMGGHLAIFDQPTEQAWVGQNIGVRHLKDGQLCWVGGFAESKADGWRWVDGRPIGAVAWHPGQPNVATTLEAGEYPAFQSLRNFTGQIGLCDESDSATGSRTWPVDIAGFLVEWE